MLQATRPALVLASASAARRALLSRAGLTFDTVPAEIDEAAIRRSGQAAGETAGQVALSLALAKARAVAEVRPDAVIIAADQILVCQGVWFAKPATLDDARAQLMRLRGREHRLETAAVIVRAGEVLLRHLAQPRLTMREFSDAFLDTYVTAEGATILESVGCYRLEGLGLHLFDQLEGEYAAILGLPMLAVLDTLRRAGVVAA